MHAIDAVISWVDGHDPIYQQKLQAYCHELGIQKDDAVEPTRIQQSNEIYYCLHALQRFAPWLRTIYLMTNQQTPTCIDDLPFAHKIVLIDQNELLNELNITTPIFNSLSAEWLIWRIKGLSENFLYLNDDFFLIRAVKPEDFFHNGCSVLYGAWKKQSQSHWFKRKLQNNPHRAWQEKSAQRAGWDKQFFLLEHAPFALIKSTYEAFVAKNPDVLLQNCSRPFRHPEHLSSIPLMTHMDMKQKRAIDGLEERAIMVNGACHSFKKIKSRLDAAQKKQHITFLCMQSLDQAPKETRDFMRQWLDRMIFFNRGLYQ